MRVLLIDHLGPAAPDYRGCGKAWAALNDKGDVVALRYMDTGKANNRQATFQEHRYQAKAYLAQRGTVVSGECSCWEFLTS